MVVEIISWWMPFDVHLCRYMQALDRLTIAFFVTGLPIMEQGNTENMCCHSDRVRHSSCGRIQHISPALPENVSSGHGEKCAYLPSDKTSPTPHDFTNATSPLPNVMPVHFLTSFNLLTTELSEDTLISVSNHCVVGRVD